MRLLSYACAATVWVSALQVAHAQQPRAAVVPESITVGDVFHAAIRVDLPQGAQLVTPDTLAVPADVESAGRREVSVDTVGGSRVATVTYPLAAWRPGTYALPDAVVHVVTDGRTEQVSVSLPSFTVQSVLPADTAGLEPQAAKDVMGANRVWWPILLALLLAAAIAVAVYIWWRRRRPVPVVVTTPAVPARTVALERLRELRESELLEKGEVKLYYGRLTAALREYAAAVRPGWGADLTTSELGARLRADLPVTDALELVRILGSADLVKFARARPTVETARADLDSAERWVGRVDRAEPATEGSLEAA